MLLGFTPIALAQYCVPACRSGHLCAQGACVPFAHAQCVPACNNGYVCSRGTCVPLPVGQHCVPTCRSGYFCSAGRCVSACNPPCERGERCDSGECVAGHGSSLGWGGGGGCVPVCRAGYLCFENKCVSPCNPECAPQYVCVEGRCVPRGGAGPAGYGYASAEKSPAVAWALEFLIGFGSGHYYAGNNTAGVLGTIASLVEWTGISLVIASTSAVECDAYGDCSGDESLLLTGVSLWVIGGVGNLVSWISAPIIVNNDNEERRRQLMSRGSSGTFHDRFFGERRAVRVLKRSRLPSARGQIILPFAGFTF